MKVFLLDLWMDLREKRLAWVAVALLAAVVLVPVVLWEGQQDQAAPPAGQTAASNLPLEPVVKSDAQAGRVDSKLESFNPRDPFEGGAAAAPAATGGDTGAGTAPATGGDTTAPATGGGGTTGGGDTGGGTTGEPGTGGGGTGGGGGGGGTTQPQRSFFTYTTDLRFGATDRIRTYRNVNRLELIPNENDPKIVFLGVTTSARTAVFLVDSGLGVDTEGACRPSPDECTFLYLRPDADHDTAQFTDSEGNTYEMRLLDINRVAVSSADGGSSGDQPQSGSGQRSPAFTGSNGDKDSKQSKDSSDSSDSAAGEPAGETPPGERSQSFKFRGFFADESR